MQKWYIILIIVGAIGSMPVWAQSGSSNPSLATQLNQPMDEVDLGLVCLSLAKDVYPELRIETFDRGLDYMVQQIQFLQGQYPTDPETLIGLLNTYLFRPGWWNDSVVFTYDDEDLQAARPINRYLNGILATRQGSCVTMAMLYVVLGDRLDWPIAAVRAPHHLFCRWETPGFAKKNIEPTGWGGYIPDSQYQADLAIPDTAIANGVYMRSLTKQEYIATLLHSHARYWHEEAQDIPTAIRYEQWALALDSTLSGAHWNLSHYYAMYRDSLQQALRDTLAAMHQHFLVKTQHLRHPPQAIPSRRPPELARGDPSPLPGSTPPTLLNVPTPDISQPSPSPQPQSASGKSNVTLEIVREHYAQARAQVIADYRTQIAECTWRIPWHRQQAARLGIQLRIPDAFYRKQHESIERHRTQGTDPYK